MDIQIDFPEAVAVMPVRFGGMLTSLAIMSIALRGRLPFASIRRVDPAYGPGGAPATPGPSSGWYLNEGNQYCP